MHVFRISENLISRHLWEGRRTGRRDVFDAKYFGRGSLFIKFYYEA